MRADVLQRREAAVLLRGLRIATHACPVRHCRSRPARLRLIGAAARAGLRIKEISVLVKALESNDARAVRSARRSVGKSIVSGVRHAAAAAGALPALEL